jgi:uncharacterized protein (TIGR02001 family)
MSLSDLGTAVFAVAFLGAAPACAQIETPAGVLYPQLSLVSDYRYNGFSNSDGRPTVQADLYLWRPDRLYAGLEVSRVRFDDGSHIDVEIDAYGGRHFDRGKTELTLEGMTVWFPDQRGRAPTYSFVQASLKARRSFGPRWLGAEATFTPQGSYHAGRGWRFTGLAGYRVAPWLSFDGRLGLIDSQRAQDRTFWDAGVTLGRGPLALDLRYVDTNLTRAQCFYSDRCEPAFVGKLTISLPQKGASR